MGVHERLGDEIAIGIHGIDCVAIDKESYLCDPALRDRDVDAFFSPATQLRISDEEIMLGWRHLSILSTVHSVADVGSPPSVRRRERMGSHVAWVQDVRWASELQCEALRNH